MRTGTREELARAIPALRRRSLAFFEALSDETMAVPYLEILNPPLWELGHVGWFQELWCLRWPLPAARGASDEAVLADAVLPQADALYNSSRVAHRSRWRLALPGLDATRDYLARVMELALERLARGGDDDDALYFQRLAYFHECMHLEAFTYTWQTLGRPLPEGLVDEPDAPSAAKWLEMPAGQATIGRAGPGFCHDNECPPQVQAVQATRIASAPVTQGEFLAFVLDGGYREARWWAPEAFERLQREARQAPRYWQRVAADGAAGPAFLRQRFGRAQPLDPAMPMVHVDADEAQAYCRWAGVRLPTEAQWVSAATTLNDFTWGGHVWEWTSSAFEPLPGFTAGPYQDYSRPWFHDHRVVRGGSFATPRSMVDHSFRNFYRPHRGDIFIGFRVCQ